MKKLLLISYSNRIALYFNFFVFSSLGPQDSTILCYIENEKFTSYLCNSVFKKLHELAISVLLHKYF